MFRIIRRDAIIDLRHMVALRMSENPRAMSHATRFWVRGPVVQARNPRGRDGRGAHRARFQRDVDIMTGQPFAFRCGTGFPDYQYLRMCSWIAQLACTVAGLRDHSTIRSDKNRANRHLTTCSSGTRLCQSDFHMAFERHGPVFAF